MILEAFDGNNVNLDDILIHENDQMIQSMYRLKNCQSRILVIVPRTRNEQEAIGDQDYGFVLDRGRHSRPGRVLANLGARHIEWATQRRDGGHATSQVCRQTASSVGHSRDTHVSSEWIGSGYQFRLDPGRMERVFGTFALTKCSKIAIDHVVDRSTKT